LWLFGISETPFPHPKVLDACLLACVVKKRVVCVGNGRLRQTINEDDVRQKERYVDLYHTVAKGF